MTKDSKNDKDQGKITVEEAGRKGGEAVSQKNMGLNICLKLAEKEENALIEEIMGITIITIGKNHQTIKK